MSLKSVSGALVAEVAADTIIINSPNDFEPAVGGEIPTIARKIYFLGNDVTVTDPIRCAPDVTFTSNSAFGSKLKSTSTSGLFVGGDGNFRLVELQVAADSGPLFTFVDTTPGTSLITIESWTTFECVDIGSFTDILGLDLDNAFINDPVNLADGLVLSGSSFQFIGIREITTSSTDAGFIGIDFTGVVSTAIEVENYVNIGVPGGIGIKGAPASANLAVNAIGDIINCTLGLGGATPLSGIGPDDIRWRFVGCSGIADTQPDALLSFKGNSTTTVISGNSTDGSQAVLIAGTWTCNRESHFSCTAAGRATYIGETPLITPIDVTATLNPNNSNDIAIYIALNGTPITNTGQGQFVKNDDPETVSTLWQIRMVKDDFVEIFVENQTGVGGSDNVLVPDIIFRLR